MRPHTTTRAGKSPADPLGARVIVYLVRPTASSYRLQFVASPDIRTHHGSNRVSFTHERKRVVVSSYSVTGFVGSWVRRNEQRTKRQRVVVARSFV